MVLDEQDGCNPFLLADWKCEKLLKWALRDDCASENVERNEIESKQLKEEAYDPHDAALYFLPASKDSSQSSLDASQSGCFV